MFIRQQLLIAPEQTNNDLTNRFMAVFLIFTQISNRSALVGAKVSHLSRSVTF